jgi:hypothetical protein
MSQQPSGRKVTICGLPFWQAVSEGSVTFNHIHGFYGVGKRITVQKSEPTGLLYVQASSNIHDGFVAACHVQKAIKLAAEILGPDHFASLEAEQEYKVRQAAKKQHTGKQ